MFVVQNTICFPYNAANLAKKNYTRCLYTSLLCLYQCARYSYDLRNQYSNQLICTWAQPMTDDVTWSNIGWAHTQNHLWYSPWSITRPVDCPGTCEVILQIGDYIGCYQTTSINFNSRITVRCAYIQYIFNIISLTAIHKANKIFLYCTFQCYFNLLIGNVFGQVFVMYAVCSRTAFIMFLAAIPVTIYKYIQRQLITATAWGTTCKGTMISSVNQVNIV